MTLEVGRRWVNGKWTTDIENEGTAGGGGVSVTISDTDPGAIGAGSLWVRLDPSESWPPMLYVRNAADDGWLDEAGAGYLLGLSFYDENGDVTTAVAGDATGLFLSTPSNSLVLGIGGCVLTSADLVNIQVEGVTRIGLQKDGATVLKNDAGATAIEFLDAGGSQQIGFFSVTPTARPEIPASPSAQDIVDALVDLGLVTQVT